MAKSIKTDVTIVGTGPGGYVAAIRAAQLGKKVAVVEKERPGGLCLNWGCIPTKALIKSAEVYEYLKKGGSFGLKVDNPTYDLNEVVDRSRGIADRMAAGVEYLFKKNKIEHIKGTGSLESQNKVSVNDGETIIESRYIGISTGTRARDIPSVKRDGERIISFREAMVIKELPRRLAIIGAGAIGMEFAYYYRCLGSEVTVLEAIDRVLPVEDNDISKEVQRSFSRKGITIETEAMVDSVTRNGDEVKVVYTAKGSKKELTADVALVAIGFVPNLEGLNLDKIGIKTHKSGISVNEYMQTAVSNIYAFGDVIGAPWLAHVASAEAVLAAEHMAGMKVHPINYDAIPGCTYCRPQVASVGYTERRAKEEKIDYTVGWFDFKASGRAIASGDSDGKVKLIFDKKNYNQIIGGHIVGGEASEMIHELVLAINMEATAEEVGKTVHAHPTLGESIMEAALDVLGERIHGA